LPTQPALRGREQEEGVAGFKAFSEGWFALGSPLRRMRPRKWKAAITGDTAILMDFRHVVSLLLDMRPPKSRELLFLAPDC